MNVTSRASILFAGILMLTIGCSRQDRPRPLSPALIAPPPRTEKSVNIDPLSSADQPGALNTAGRGISRPVLQAEAPVEQLSKTVQENVRLPGERAVDSSDASTTAPSTGPTTAGVSSGEYLTLGGIVADVNGTAISANKVLRLVEPALAPKAKQLSREQFRGLAMREIDARLKELVHFQLWYAAAERYLDQKDKDMADGLTMQWRQRQISMAGGSEEVARSRIAARGEDFDDLVQQQYRIWMSRIYSEKKLMPQIQVTADDVREYFNRNGAREFSQPDTAQFRLIKIDVAKSSNNRDEARRRITELRNRIVKAGESFEAIARSANDDSRLAASGGALAAPIQRGAFAIEPLEKAVWDTPEGKVTEIVETPNAFYIALVEKKIIGKAASFDDEAVQTQINDRLRGEQFRALQQQVEKTLLENAAVVSTNDMVNTALEMVMQNYPRWAAK